MKLINSVRYYARRLHNYHLSTYAASASFFIVIAIFPALMMLISILSYTPLKESDFIDLIEQLLPTYLHPLLSYVTEGILTSNFTTLSVSVVTVVWSASKGVLGLLDGINAVADTHDSRNFLYKRLICAGYMFALIASILFTLALRVFGRNIQAFLLSASPALSNIFDFLLKLRGLFLLGVLTLIFALIYTVFPNKKMRFLVQLPGALFTAAAWLAFSSLFSVYVDNATNLTRLYGGLTTAILAMLWLYFCMYIVFIGAVINMLYPEALLQFAVGRSMRRHRKESSPTKKTPKAPERPPEKP